MTGDHIEILITFLITTTPSLAHFYTLLEGGEVVDTQQQNASQNSCRQFIIHYRPAEMTNFPQDVLQWWCFTAQDVNQAASWSVLHRCQGKWEKLSTGEEPGLWPVWQYLRVQISNFLQVIHLFIYAVPFRLLPLHRRGRKGKPKEVYPVFAPDLRAGIQVVVSADFRRKPGRKHTNRRRAVFRIFGGKKRKMHFPRQPTSFLRLRPLSTYTPCSVWQSSDDDDDDDTRQQQQLCTNPISPFHDGVLSEIVFLSCAVFGWNLS